MQENIGINIPINHRWNWLGAPGMHRGNLVMWAGSERVTVRVCSIKWNSGAPVSLELVTEIPPLPGDYYIIAKIIIFQEISLFLQDLL